MGRKLTEIPGIRLKFRDSDDGRWLTATVWVEDHPLKEIARLDVTVAGLPGGEVYQGWVDAISRAFCGMVEATQAARDGGGVKVEALRRKARYEGEERRP